MNHTAFRQQYIRRFKNSRSPINGMFELTGRCNFNCKMCYVHTKANAEFLKTERDGDWWIAQIDEAYNRGMIFATLTGGECLLHPDFYRIYNHLREKGVYTQINTNGLLLTQKNVEFLKENPPFEIQLTLYGADDESYEKVTGISAFRQVEEAISRVKGAGLNLRISVTPNSYAPGETERIVEYLKKLQVPYSINEAMFTPYDESAPQTLSDKEVETGEKIRYLQLQNGTKYDPIPEKDLPQAGGGREGDVRGVRCSAGRVAFTITHDGCMMPCTSMYHLRVPLKTAEDFGPAWEQMLKISETFLMPIECEGCAYIKACLSCPVLRGGNVGNGHCDPAVCEMTRKLVAAGVKKIDQPEKGCD